MKTFRVAILAPLALVSVTLIACSGSSSNEPDPVVESGPAPIVDAAVPAAPLLDVCSGTYACAADGSGETVVTVLKKVGGGVVCEAGDDAFIEKDHQVTTDAGASGHQILGTWSGDSLAFDICNGGTCLRCKLDTSPSKADAGPSAGTCSGSSSCGSYGAGNCGNHSGCYLDSHAVYFMGQLDHYENTCRGTPSPCAEWTSKDTCEKQGCTWK